DRGGLRLGWYSSEVGRRLFDVPLGRLWRRLEGGLGRDWRRRRLDHRGGCFDRRRWGLGCCDRLLRRWWLFRLGRRWFDLWRRRLGLNRRFLGFWQGRLERHLDPAHGQRVRWRRRLGRQQQDQQRQAGGVAGDRQAQR